MKRAKILYDRETMQELIKTFKVSSPTVRDALACKTNSALANRIRKRALDMGCKVKEVEVVKKVKYI
jgi:DNA-binding GntR family transcriptional regulator